MNPGFLSKFTFDFLGIYAYNTRYNAILCKLYRGISGEETVRINVGESAGKQRMSVWKKKYRNLFRTCTR